MISMKNVRETDLTLLVGNLIINNTMSTINYSKVTMTDGSIYLLSKQRNFPSLPNHSIKTNRYTGEKLMVNEANGFCYKLSK